MKVKNILKRIGTFVIAFTLIISSVVISKAANDNHEYAFNLKAHYGNSYSAARYRQTTNTANKWKVNLVSSSEGKGKKATFWLAKDNKSKTIVSATHDVAQGTGAHYYKAKSKASKTDVKLGAENNNDSPNTYAISGYWDEETN